MSKSLVRLVAISLAVLLSSGCANKLSDAAVKNTLTRFVREFPLIKEYAVDTATLGSVGPIVMRNSEASVEFMINYRRGTSTAEEAATATFAKTQDGKWILTKVRGERWGGGWWSRPGSLNWEVK